MSHDTDPLDITDKERLLEILAERRQVVLDKVDWRLGSPHDLRKTYGNTMKRYVSVDVLKRLMGHSDISTTMKFYTGATADDEARVRHALAAVFGGQTDEQADEQAVKSSAGDVPVVRKPPSRYHAALRRCSSAG